MCVRYKEGENDLPGLLSEAVSPGTHEDKSSCVDTCPNCYGVSVFLRGLRQHHQQEPVKQDREIQVFRKH